METVAAPLAATASSTTRRRHRHLGLAAFAGAISASAWFGVAGLTTGLLDLGPEVTPRLPFASPVLGGLALAVVVAVPTLALAVLAAIGHPATGRAAVAAGVLQVGWIVVELAFIRELSFFHPLYLGVGALLIVWGGRLRAADERPDAAR